MGKWSKELGNAGEDLACQYLEEKGYKILGRNYYASHTEIDIIAQDQNFLVFVEVKNYSYRSFGAPAQAVGKAKKQNLAYAAQNYLKNNRLPGRHPRFDVLTIYRDFNGETNIKHYQNAFYVNRQGGRICW